MFKALPVNTKGSLSKHLKTLASGSLPCRHDQLRDENEGLAGELKASQTIAAKLQCQVVNAERNLLDKENVGSLLKEKEKAWEEERAGWMVEREQRLGMSSITRRIIRNWPQNAVSYCLKDLGVSFLLSPNPQTSKAPWRGFIRPIGTWAIWLG
ncbi:hypothetical protein HanPI659440_Chr13g0502601 [Helianthus annuus]|nr:hypothetical protein HanPI659440_Chr13g0502601 [Helianthus annuus]